MRYAFLFLFLCTAFSASLTAQAKPKTVDLKKGQVFDIIFLTNKPDTKDLMQDYFKRASPIAQANGYASGGGFGIAGTPIRGNYQPKVMAIGTWPGVAERTAGVVALETQMTDFHEMRRKVWPTFNLTYYEMQEDASFTIKTDKYYVVTSFWAEKKGSFKKFLKQWEAAQAKAGGTPLLVLTDGTSPFGYNFEPDYFTITEWESEAAFRSSLPEDNKRGYPGVRHLNQFQIK